MTEYRKPQISSRKQPKQARANDLVAAVLDAAIQVLRSEGAARFTTARVAERAGVSVGSLYQYFPNKASILFRLQSDEWHRTSAMLRDILEDRSATPDARLRSLTHAFIQSECDEAEVRIALADAAPLYRDAPETSEASVILTFMREALPGCKGVNVEMTADLVEMTLSQVGSQFSEQPRSATQIAAFADAMADMFSAYLRQLTGGSCRHQR
jgi:AcrR family transcriptional regulator